VSIRADSPPALLPEMASYTSQHFVLAEDLSRVERCPMSAPSSTDLLHHALLAEQAGRFDQAADLLRQLARGADAAAALDARLRLGKLLIQRGHDRYADAEETLQGARLQAEAAGASRHAAQATHLLALLQHHRGRTDDAENLLAESPVHRLQGASGPEVGQYFHYRGLCAAARSDLANAERFCFRALQSYDEIHYSQGQAEVCDSLANLLLRRGKSRHALAFARRSLELKRKLGDRYGEAISWGTIGRVCLLQARYAEAAEAFRQDLDLATALGDARGIGIARNSVGEAALMAGDFETAAEHYRRNLEVDRGPVNTAHAHLGLARAHFVANRLDEAAATIECMGEVLALNPDVRLLPDVLVGLRGSLAWRRGDFAGGETLLQQSIDSLVRHRADLDTIPYLYELRDLYQKCGRTPDAVRVMARALDLLSECGSEQGVGEVERWLGTVDQPALTRLLLERFIPGHVVAEILAGNRGPLLDRRQEVAVLFCDVRDYTALSEGLQPEEVMDLLNEWFGEATRAIRRHGGMVDKFIGDAVMALFGAPEPRDDAAADAVRAALAMRDALVALNLRNRALERHEIHVGIGIHSGPAVVGFLGSHLHRAYTAIGDTVNTASRLEGLTRAYNCDVLISQEVDAVQQRHAVAETSFLDKVKVKGRQQEVAVYKVMGLRTDPRTR
jgi:class 3 adenylate cyclase/tetratricopeptide (TPR) repeat protein